MSKHYLWYDATGILSGRSRQAGLGGFDVSVDPSDAGTVNSEALALRDYFLTTLGLTGCVAYDCPCAEVDINCVCDSIQVNDYYVDAGSLVAKPSVQFVIDGGPAADMGEAFIDGTPGANITLQIVAAVPEGHVVTFGRMLTDIHQTDPVFTFTAGASNTVTLVHPAQGMSGLIHGVSKYLKLSYLRLRGWT